MKYVVAIIQPYKFDAVRDALLEQGIAGIIVSEVQGYGREEGKEEVYRGVKYEVNFRPKIKLEIAVSAERAEAVVEIIQKSSESGRVGDGKIFIFDLEQAVRIRTGEIGESAV